MGEPTTRAERRALTQTALRAPLRFMQ